MADTIERESPATTGGYTPSVSADGRYVEFHGFSSQTVYVEDRQTGLLLTLPRGGVATNGYSWGTSASVSNSAGPTNASISADGKKVVFSSQAFSGSDFRNSAIFVYDLASGSVTMASNTSGGFGPSQDTAYQDTQGPTISGDGSIVAFESAASGVTSTTTPSGTLEVYVRNALGSIVLASSDANGAAGSASSLDGTLSQNGSFVAFATSSTNFAHGQNAGNAVYVKNLATGALTWASPDESYTSHPSISADGTKVVFAGYDKTTYQSGIWLRDLTAGTTTLVSTDVNGMAANGGNLNPILSADGKNLFFQSNATNLPSGAGGTKLQNYVKDLTTGAVTLLFDNTGANTFSNPQTKGQIFSADDRIIAFATDTPGLTADDADAQLDAFALVRTPPTITGTHPTASAGEMTVSPFSGVAIADAGKATESVRIQISGGGGTLAGDGLIANPDGSYSLAAAAPGTITTELDGLTFTPKAGSLGVANMTTFTLTVTSNNGLAATDVGTVVTDTAVATPAPTPPPTPDPAPEPTPAPTLAPGAPGAPGTVSLSSRVSYADGTFTLSGTASSAAGVAGVEISAVVNGGERQDLGAATVKADGTFDFSDLIGANVQGFIEATLIDGAGHESAVADASFSLTGGLGPRGGAARQSVYTPDGSAVTATTLFRPNGLPTTTVGAPGQTFTSTYGDVFENDRRAGTAFVFEPGYSLDVIDGFRLRGPGHDTLSFLGSDFGRNPAAQLAHLLANTQDLADGLLITDPTTQDAVKLVGFTKDQLVHNERDIVFR